MVNKRGLMLVCNGCGNQWNYSGSAPVWATCPKCRNKVSLKSNSIGEIVENENTDDKNNINSSKEEADTKGAKKEVEPKNSTPIQEEENTDEEIKPLELIQEKPEVVNPDNYDWRCSSCAELFNTDGNLINGKLKCPDCGLELDYYE